MGEAAHAFRTGRVGRRFRNFYLCRKNRTKESLIMHWTMIGLGILLILVGAILGPTPLVPGAVVALPGLAILCSRSLIAARFLDFLDRKLWRLRARWHRYRFPKDRGCS